MGLQECLYAAGRTVKWHSHSKNNLALSSKVEDVDIQDIAIQLLGLYTKEPNALCTSIHVQECS